MSLRYHVAPPRSLGPPPGFGIGRTRHEMMYSGMPPRGEVRYLPREWVVQIADEVPRAQIDALAAQLGVTVVAAQGFGFGGRTIYHFRSTGERDVPDLIRQMEQNRIVASAQPNYVYRVTQLAPRPRPAELPPLVPPPANDAGAVVAPAAPAGADAASVAAAEALPPGDATQYTIEKLQLRAVHQQARGRGIAIAVIDSEVDGRHPDIQRAVKERFDPTGSRSAPDNHGTGMAGAIASRQRLLGVAPDAEIVAIRAFDNKAGGAEATSFQILKGLDHAMRRNVRIINMSFAGPYDGMIERKLQAAYERGIVLVAAAGNAGPKSPPLYPAASPSVIGVTALDAGDQPFTQANQGKHVAIAAPGVEILVPAPNDTYQLTTGTSVAAAHVSGVVALMLEKRPELTPDDVRAILAGSATAIAVTRDNRTGAGLINPLKALTYDLPADSVAPMAAAAPAPRAPAAASSAARTGVGPAATTPRPSSAPIAPGPRAIGAVR
jgi:subtilisin family serine protease